MQLYLKLGLARWLSQCWNDRVDCPVAGQVLREHELRQFSLGTGVIVQTHYQVSAISQYLRIYRYEVFDLMHWVDYILITTIIISVVACFAVLFCLQSLYIIPLVWTCIQHITPTTYLSSLLHISCMSSRLTCICTWDISTLLILIASFIRQSSFRVIDLGEALQPCEDFIRS